MHDLVIICYASPQFSVLAHSGFSKHVILMSALARFNKPLKVHSSRYAYNRFISNDTHDLHDPYFPKSVLNTTNEHCKCEGQKQYNIVQYDRAE